MAISTCQNAIDDQGRELVQHGTPQFPIACYQDDLMVETVPWHWHEELEALIVTQGETFASAGGQNFLLSRGDGLFINREVLHSDWLTSLGDCKLHSLVFHPRLVGGSPDSIFWKSYLNPLLNDTALEGVAFSSAIAWHREALEAIEAAWQACAQEPSGYEFQVRSALSRLIFLLVSHHDEGEQPSEKELRNQFRIKAMLQFIHAHYGEPLTTKAIASSASISESECLRCFKSTLGTTPIQYLREYRIQQAAALLTATDWSISQIGAHCGFQEMSYFSRTFRRLKGCAPGEYRGRIIEHQSSCFRVHSDK